MMKLVIHESNVKADVTLVTTCKQDSTTTSIPVPLLVEQPYNSIMFLVFRIYTRKIKNY